MTAKCSLIIGGARSGKSRFAQELAMSLSDKVLFAATAEPLNEDMQNRIARHKSERPQTWQTIEVPTDLASQIKHHLEDKEVVIIDCLTLLTSNVLLGQSRGFSDENRIEEQAVENQLMTKIEALIDLMNKSNAIFIIVSNEVGLGLVPDNDIARIYRDLLGRVNQAIAQYADEVYFLLAGITLKVKG